MRHAFHLLHTKITQVIGAARATSVYNKIVPFNFQFTAKGDRIYFGTIQGNSRKRYISEVNCVSVNRVKLPGVFCVERTIAMGSFRFNEKQAFSISLILALKVPCVIISTTHDSGVT